VSSKPSQLTSAWRHESMAGQLHVDVVFNNEVDPATRR
jgi:hypothetical protein